MNKIIIASAALLFLLVSCTDNGNLAQSKLIAESLRNSRLIMDKADKKIYEELADKLKDPASRSKAEIWQPKAVEIQTASVEIMKYLDSLKNIIRKNAGFANDTATEIYRSKSKNLITVIFEKQGNASELAQKLFNFKRVITDVIRPENYSGNAYFQQYVSRHIDELRKNILTDIPNNQNQAETGKVSIGDYFKNTSAGEAIVILEGIKNEVVAAENKMLVFINDQVGGNRDLTYDKFSAIVTLSSSYVKAGQPLSIYAGLGSFNDASKPTFIINSRKVSVVDGIATYDLIASKKPGKHSIPVKIEFTKPDGSPCIKTYEAKYEVAQ